MKQKNENAPRPGGAGRKPKADPAVFRYSISFNAIDHARFLALFDQSGMRTKAHFITARIFGEPFKVIKIDKAAVGILYPADRFIFPVQGYSREL